MKKFIPLMLIAFECCFAQTDLRVSGPQSGFPIAVAQLCNAGVSADAPVKVPDTISKDLDLSGLFKLVNPASFVEAPGKCNTPNGITFSDWSVIGAEGLVKGTVKPSGSGIEVELYLYDVLQQRPVLGKRYNAGAGDSSRIAHRFANEIMKYFTGEPGFFGSQIAFVSRVGRYKEIFVMDLDGANLRQLTRDRGLAVSPSFSPTGDALVYTSYRTRRPELYIAAPDGSSGRQLTDRPGLELGAKFLRDGGSLIAAATFDGISNLVLFDLKGKVIRRLTNSGAIDVSPSVSPDGSQVAYTSSRGGGPQIYVIPLAGGEPKRISFTGSSYCTSPSWSPKGDKIAFVCTAGGNQIFVSPVDGGQAVQLTFAGNNEDPAWSPDGKYILYSTTALGGGRSLALLNTTTGVSKAITQSRSEDSQPAWGAPLN